MTLLRRCGTRSRPDGRCRSSRRVRSPCPSSSGDLRSTRLALPFPPSAGPSRGRRAAGSRHRFRRRCASHGQALGRRIAAAVCDGCGASCPWRTCDRRAQQRPQGAPRGGASRSPGGVRLVWQLHDYIIAAAPVDASAAPAGAPGRRHRRELRQRLSDACARCGTSRRYVRIYNAVDCRGSGRRARSASCRPRPACLRTTGRCGLASSRRLPAGRDTKCFIDAS